MVWDLWGDLSKCNKHLEASCVQCSDLCTFQVLFSWVMIVAEAFFNSLHVTLVMTSFSKQIPHTVHFCPMLSSWVTLINGRLTESCIWWQSTTESAAIILVNIPVHDITLLYLTQPSGRWMHGTTNNICAVVIHKSCWTTHCINAGIQTTWHSIKKCVLIIAN